MQFSNKNISLQQFQVGDRNQVRTNRLGNIKQAGKTEQEPGSDSNHTVRYNERELVATLSRPWTNRPVSYLKEDSTLQRREHFLSAGGRKRQRVRTICKITVRFQHFLIIQTMYSIAFRWRKNRFGHIFVAKSLKRDIIAKNLPLYGVCKCMQACCSVSLLNAQKINGLLFLPWFLLVVKIKKSGGFLHTVSTKCI